MEFVQDNQSASKKGVLRGLHFQINYPQDKLVRVVSGEVYDVAVDLRKGSKTYGKWFGVLLSAENKKQFFIPKNLHMAFWCSLTMRSSLTNVQTSIIPMMRADFPGKIRTSTYSGPFRKAWS